MQDTRIQRLAKHAKQDGLSLPWSMRFLMEKLEPDTQRIGRLRQRDTREGESAALEAEALALVLEALRRAYPAGSDLSFD